MSSGTPPLGSTALPVGDPLPDRITVTGTIYHERAGGKGMSVECGHEQHLATREQVFERWRTLTEEWEPLVPERSWLQDDAIGMVAIRNEEGRNTGPPRQVQATPEEKAAMAAKVIEVRLHADHAADANCLLIPPKQSLRLMAKHPDRVLIRSQAGDLRYSVFVFPR